MTPMTAVGTRPEGLTVMGEATRSAAPEMVDLTLDVHAAAPNAAQALRDNAMKVMQIAQAMAAVGVPQNEIESRPGTVYPMHQAGNPLLPMGGFLPASGAGPFLPVPQPNFPPDVSPLVGYHVVSYLKLSVRELGRLGEIVDAATRAGANLSAGFLFRLRDEPGLRRALLEAAGREARSKAESLASALGRQLGEALSATEDFSTYYLGAAMPGMHAVSPGELTFQARVNVTYALAAAALRT